MSADVNLMNGKTVSGLRARIKFLFVRFLPIGSACPLKFQYGCRDLVGRRPQLLADFACADNLHGPRTTPDPVIFDDLIQFLSNNQTSDRGETL